MKITHDLRKGTLFSTAIGNSMGVAPEGDNGGYLRINRQDILDPKNKNKFNEQINADLMRLIQHEKGHIASTFVRHAITELGWNPDKWMDIPLKDRTEIYEGLMGALENIKKNPGPQTIEVNIDKQMREKTAWGPGWEPVMSDDGANWKLKKPNGSSLHHLIEYVRSTSKDKFDHHFAGYQSFVVEHDWATAFKGAENFATGDFKLPYDRTAFEFSVSNARVILLLFDEDSIRRGILAMGVDGTWSMAAFSWLASGIKFDRRDNDRQSNLLNMLTSQVRAVCIMLEAEVAVGEVVRQPEKLNAKRVKLGRTPLKDYHVVLLAHRHRMKPAEGRAADFDPDYTRKRLHFRRSHVRRYQNYSVNIKWQLVGDPDLGFVDKHYRL